MLMLADEQKKKMRREEIPAVKVKRGEREGIKGGTDGGEGARRRKEEVVKVLVISENPFRRNLKQIDFLLAND